MLTISYPIDKFLGSSPRFEHCFGTFHILVIKVHKQRKTFNILSNGGVAFFKAIELALKGGPPSSFVRESLTNKSNDTWSAVRLVSLTQNNAPRQVRSVAVTFKRSATQPRFSRCSLIRNYEYTMFQSLVHKPSSCTLSFCIFLEHGKIRALFKVSAQGLSFLRIVRTKEFS